MGRINIWMFGFPLVSAIRLTWFIIRIWLNESLTLILQNSMKSNQNGKLLLTPALEKNVLVSIIRIRLWGSSVGPTLQLP